jgi:predicted nucleic acid-binding protein
MKLFIFAGRIPRRHHCKDPEDAYLLDLADATQADYLITGDRRSGLLDKLTVGRASILTAKAFVERLSL